MKEKTLTVVGGVPRPIGGVTVFIFRLVSTWPSRFSLLLDLYPSEGKQSVPVPSKVLSTMPLVRLFLFFLFNKEQSVYFNFSRAKGLVLLGILPKRKGSRWGVTLHNGDLKSGTPKDFFRKTFFSMGVKKCDVFGVLSPLQRQFYLENGVSALKLKSIASFIPRESQSIPEVSADKFPEIVDWIKERTRVFVVSGSPTKIYQHLEVLSVFEKIWTGGVKDIRLVAFLYGDDSDGILTEISTQFKSSPCASMFWGFGDSDFLSVLKCSAGYLRMNTVDSYGIGVAEAVSLGVPTLASNVCKRFEGARLVEPSNWIAVEDFICETPSPDSRSQILNAGVKEKVEIEKFLQNICGVEV